VKPKEEKIIPAVVKEPPASLGTSMMNMKNTTQSFIASNHTSICNHPSNSSPSKHLFSFSKAERFDFNKKPM
jgi:hypothetical protein